MWQINYIKRKAYMEYSNLLQPRYNQTETIDRKTTVELLK